jgi:hypothetical protein
VRNDFRDCIRGTWQGVLGIKCAMRMKDGSWCSIEVCRKKERKVGNGRSTDLGGLVWYLDSTRQFHHGYLLVWSFSPIVIVPSLFSLSFVARGTQPCLLRQGEKNHHCHHCEYSDLAVAESVPASIHFEVNLRYIYIFTPFTCLR